MRFPGVPRTKSSILLTIRIHQIWWRVTGLPKTLDAFNAIPRRAFDRDNNNYCHYVIQRIAGFAITLYYVMIIRQDLM
jgi:hypothetical protein